MICVENLSLIQSQTFDNVLIGMRMNGLFEGLPKEVLSAFRRRYVPIGPENNVVGGQRIRSDEESEISLDQATLIFGQTIRVLPQGDVAAHVDFLRHPVVGATGEVFLQGPLVLE